MLLGWTILLSTAIASGGLVCAGLVSRRRVAPLAWMGAAALAASTVSAMVQLHRLTGRTDATVAATFIAIGAFLGGFALGAALVPVITRLPTPSPVGQRGVGRGTGDMPPGDATPDDVPWIVFVAAGQPEHYAPSTVTQYFARLAQADVRLPGETARVLAYLSERVRYRGAGMDPSRPVVREVVERATRKLRDSGFAGRTAEAWLQGTPRLADALELAATHGARDIAVVMLGVAESYEFDHAIKEAQTLELGSAGVRVEYAPPLWADERLTAVVEERVLAALPGGVRKSDGVLLVASGQPWQWDRTHPQGSEHETFFCQKVRAEFLGAGLAQSHVRTAWLDWQEPDVTEAVRHLSAVGCERIVVVPATAPADTLAIVTELPAAVAQAAAGEAVSVQVLHGWGDDDTVAEVLADAARATLAELGRSADEGQ